MFRNRVTPLVHDAGMATITAPVDWHTLANCAGVEPDLFFPVLGGDAAKAKAVCQECPVREECLRDAIARDEWVGVWGGLTAVERRRLVRRGTSPSPRHIRRVIG